MRAEDQDCDGNSTKNDIENDSDLTTEETQKILDAGVALSIIRTRRSVEKALNYTKSVGQVQSIVKLAIGGVLSGQEKTEGDSVKNQSSGIERTELEPLRKSEKEVSVTTLPRSLGQQFDDFGLAKSESLSLIDSSAKALHECLKKLVNEQTQNPDRITPIDTFRVNAAVKCADSIGKLMKIKVEAFKTFRDINGPKT